MQLERVKKVCFTHSGEPGKPFEGDLYVERIIEEFKSQCQDRYELSNRDDCDLLIFLEPNNEKNLNYAKRLLADPEISRYLEKTFVFSYAYFTVAFLPGCYVSLPKQHHDPHRHRSACYLNEANIYVEELAQNDNSNPEWTMSFHGAISWPVRQHIIDLADDWKSLGPIEMTTGWFDHSEDQQKGYIRNIQNSKFVLCPRGVATSSYRLYETMQLGRVPVIIADEWVPPSHVDWDRFSLRVGEFELEKIPDLVKEHEPRWREMAQEARRVWEENFSPGARVIYALDRISEIYPVKDATIENYRQIWMSKQFRYKFVGSPLQRLEKQLRKIARRVLRGK